MLASPYAPTPEQDERHQTSPAAPTFWNESFWFPMYDPALDVGIVFRIGLYPRWDGGRANLYLTIVQRGRVVLSLTDQLLPLQPHEPRRLAGGHGLSVEWD